MTFDMRVFICWLMLMVLCGTSCTTSAAEPIQIQNVGEIQFSPVGAPTYRITNAAELMPIVEWLNTTLRKPISSFTLKSYPKPVHTIVIKFKTEGFQTYLISSGSVLESQMQTKMDGVVERLTVLSINSKEYLSNYCPEALLFPRPRKPPARD